MPIKVGIVFLTLLISNCQTGAIDVQKDLPQGDFKGERVIKTEEQWRAVLTDEEYYVLREEGTERAFTGDLWNHEEHGTYTCAGCGLPLFHSDTKFKSGTGWPSFFKPVEVGHVNKIVDHTYGMSRIEVECARCGGHLGHVFEDGPKPTGMRYCINSISMNFEKDSLK